MGKLTKEDIAKSDKRLEKNVANHKKAPMEKIQDVSIMILTKDLSESKINDAIFHNLDSDDFESLKTSIKETGLIEPLIVRQKKANSYEVLCGHQRLRAIKELHIKEAPCILRNDLMEDPDATVVLIESNLRRRQLSPSEISKAITKLKELRHSRDEISAALEISNKQASVYTSIGEHLIDKWHDVLHKNNISIKDAYGLSQMPAKIQEKIFDAVRKSGADEMSTKIADEMIGKNGGKQPDIDKGELKKILADKEALQAAIKVKDQEIEELKSHKKTSKANEPQGLSYGLRTTIDSFMNIIDEAKKRKDVQTILYIDEHLDKRGYKNEI